MDSDARVVRSTGIDAGVRTATAKGRATANGIRWSAERIASRWRHDTGIARRTVIRPMRDGRFARALNQAADWPHAG